jgi:hypothetical protein
MEKIKIIPYTFNERYVSVCKSGTTEGVPVEILGRDVIFQILPLNFQRPSYQQRCIF